PDRPCQTGGWTVGVFHRLLPLHSTRHRRHALDLAWPMTKAPRILIVTNGPLARNPRVLKEASALGSAGYEVGVITLRNHAPSEPLDEVLCRNAPFRRIPVDLIPGYSVSRRRV